MADFGINWGLGVAPDAGGAFTQGFQNGQAMRREADTRNALATYAQDPNMQNANALIAVDPRIGMQARQQQMEMDKAARAQQAIAAATQGGDHQSVGALVQMGVPYETARQINQDHVAQLGKTADFLGQVGLQISTAPEEQRPQLWSGALQQAQALGIQVPPEFQQYSPQALSGVLAASKQVKEAIGLTDPKYMAVPQGGYLENVNPRSRPNAVPTGPASMPQPGHTEDGYQFNGGDPSNPANWTKIGGATPTASGGFPQR